MPANPDTFRAQMGSLMFDVKKLFWTCFIQRPVSVWLSFADVPHKDVVDNDLWSESWIMAAEWQATLSEFGQEAGFDVALLTLFPL